MCTSGSTSEPQTTKTNKHVKQTKQHTTRAETQTKVNPTSKQTKQTIKKAVYNHNTRTLLVAAAGEEQLSG